MLVPPLKVKTYTFATSFAHSAVTDDVFGVRLRVIFRLVVDILIFDKTGSDCFKTGTF
jgi:hypothetical protein